MVRITQSMQIARTLRDQNINLARMSEYSKNMSDGTTLHRPSDDPIRVSRAMRLMSELNVNETYKSDLDAASSWVSKTGESLKTLSSIIARTRELTTQAATGTLTAEDKQKIAAELKQLKAAAINMGNDDYMGRYQFSGYKTDVKFLNEDGKYNTQLNLAGLNYEKINYNIGVGQKTDINISGVQVFGNEYFTTKTRAMDALPFSDEAESILGANMNIKLQKYKQPDKFYDKNPAHTSGDASIEDKKNDELESKYEKTTKLDTKDGNEITLDNIGFYGKYKKDDINSVIEDLNKSLRAKIDEKCGADVEKAKELKQAVQFVNDDGKISLVTDRDYAGKIEPSRINLSEIKTNTAQTSTPTVNGNHEIQTVNGIRYNNGAIPANPVKSYFNFDMELVSYKKDANGDITNVADKTFNLKNIMSVNSYSREQFPTDESMQEMIKADLQTKINEKLLQNSLPPDTVKVVIENGQPKLIVNREYKATVSNTSNNVYNANTNLTNQSYTPANDNPALNPQRKIDAGINLGTRTDNKDVVLSMSFDMDVTIPQRYGLSQGDVLISNPNTPPVNGLTPPGKGGFLKTPIVANSTHLLKGIAITKTYSGKNADGSDKSNDDLLKEIAKDLQAQIDQKAAYSNPPLTQSKINVVAENGRIKMLVDGNLKYELKNVENNIAPNTFDTTAKTPVRDSKSDLTLPMPTINPTGDTNAYMDINPAISHYKKDEKGNPITTEKESTINADKITLNKTYPRKKADGTPYTDAEIKDMIFNDVKKAIEEKLGQINPPLDKKAINISMVGNDIKLSVYPDIEVKMSSNPQKPDSLTKDTTFMPKQTADLQPQREMMPFFEMMDRLTQFMEEGNSKGLSRMLDVIDYHAKNNQKNQGIGGGKSKMYDIMISRTQDVKLNYSELLSETRDTDYSEMVARMSVAQNVYRASLAVTAKLIQPSLVDFLR